MTVEIDRLIVSLEARIGGYERNLAVAQAQTNQKLTAMEARFAKWGANLKNSASTAAVGIGSAFAGIGAYLGARSIIEYANAWTRLARTIDGSGRVFGQVLRPAEDLVKLANDSRVDIEAYSKLYVRTAASIRDYGFAAGTAEVVTSTLAKALKLGSATASEQASVMLQFSQALQKGKLDGDEFRTVMENAGVVQELLAERLKVSKGEIVKMAAEGKLKIQDLVAAMTEGAEKVNRIYSEMPQTVDEAFAILRNNLIQFLGQADQATGASQTLASAIVTIGNNLDKVAVAAGAILGSAALRMTAFAAATISASNPLTLLAATIGSLSVAYGIYGDEVAVSADGQISLKEAVDAFLDVLSGQDAVDEFNAKLAIMSEEQRKAASVAKRHAEEQSILNSALKDAENAFDAIATNVARLVAEADKKAGGPFSGFIESAKEMALWLGQVTGLTDLAAEGLSRVDAQARRLDLQNGIANGPNYGKGLNDFLTGKIQNPRAKPTDTSSANAKRSSFEREVEQIRKRTELLKAEAATIDKTTLAQERAKAAAELRVAAEETAKKEGRKVTAEEIKAIDTLSAKYAEASVAAQFLRTIQTRKDALAIARSEIELVGLYGQELDTARAKLELLNEAKRLGKELTPEQLAEIDGIAQATGAMEAYRRAVEDFQTTSSEVIKGFVSDLRQSKSATDALANALDNLATKLIESGIDSLVAGATGALFGKGSTGASLFGFAKGGVMVPGKGPASLPRFARGGVSRSAAIFGEAGPEAAVPLPDGRRIPVELRLPSIPTATQAAQASTTQVTLAPIFNVENGTPEGVDRLRSEIVPLITKTVHELFDRSPRFARTKI